MILSTYIIIIIKNRGDRHTVTMPIVLIPEHPLGRPLRNVAKWQNGKMGFAGFRKPLICSQ